MIEGLRVKANPQIRNIEIFFKDERDCERIANEAEAFGYWITRTFEDHFLCSLYVTHSYDFDKAVAHFQAMAQLVETGFLPAQPTTPDIPIPALLLKKNAQPREVAEELLRKCGEAWCERLREAFVDLTWK